MSFDTAIGIDPQLEYKSRVDSYQQFIEILPDPLLFCVDGIIILANEAALRLVRAKTRDQVVSRPILDFALPGETALWSSAIHKIMQRRLRHFTREDQVIPISGDPVHVEISSSHITIGDMEGIVAIFRDITERKREEARLRESEAHNRTILENTGTILLGLEEDGKISFVNTEFEKITGLTKERIIGKMTWMDFVIPSDRDRMMSYHRGRREGSQVPRNYECTLHLPDGSTRSAFVTVSMIPGTTRSLASLIDITEIRRTKRMLALTKERHRLVAEMARDSIIIFGPDGALEYMNPAACEFSGLTLESAIGLNVTRILPYRKNINLYRAIRDRKNGTSEVFIARSGFIRREGENIEVEISTSVIRSDGEPDRVLVIARDITERRRLEREVLDISETVRQQVGHDLHDDLSPHLIGIEALMEVLKCRLEKKGVEESTELERIRVLVNEAITKTHRLARGLCPVDLEAMGFAAAVNDLAHRVRSIYGIPCSFTCDRELENLGNGMAVLNLYFIVHEGVNNAVKHSGAGSIDITLSSRRGNLVLTVSDDGTGMKTGEGRKTGMGLRIMHYRAEIIRASLEIGQNNPRGTILRCTVPLQYLRRGNGE